MKQAAHKWRDVGVSLQLEYFKIKTIAGDHSDNEFLCCKYVLDTWLKSTPDASWNQLIRALRSPNVQLDSLADELEQRLDIKCESLLHYE